MRSGEVVLGCLNLPADYFPRKSRHRDLQDHHLQDLRHDPRNYRPITLTSISVKILERLIHRKIMNFLNHHNKLSSHQHGFRTAHSCQTQLLESVHHWAQSLDKRSSTHIFFLDFSKAFDSVPHEHLLIKLDCIGVRGAVLKWIRSFLTDRRQRVMLEGCTSTWAPVTSGVPQGSILGPLLFLVYINDIDTQLNSHVKLFADDCAIYNQVSCKADTSSLQSDLNSLYTW